jgi:hypothetical protein
MNLLKKIDFKNIFNYYNLIIIKMLNEIKEFYENKIRVYLNQDFKEKENNKELEIIQKIQDNINLVNEIIHDLEEANLQLDHLSQDYLDNIERIRVCNNTLVHLQILINARLLLYYDNNNNNNNNNINA